MPLKFHPEALNLNDALFAHRTLLTYCLLDRHIHYNTATAATKPAANGVTLPGKNLYTDARESWRVFPGYSSGESSLAGSDAAGDDGGFRRERLTSSDGSRHADVLALSSLRQEMVAHGDLAKTVVRIEVRSTVE